MIWIGRARLDLIRHFPESRWLAQLLYVHETRWGTRSEGALMMNAGLVVGDDELGSARRWLSET